VHHPSGERGDQAEGEVGVRGLDLHVIGIGKERAQASARRLLAFRQWSARDQLLLLGFAGGVDPALKSGDLVLSSRYYRADGVITPPSPPFSRGGTLSIPPLEKGGLGGVSPLAIEQQDFLEPDSNMWRQAIEVASEVGLSVSQGSSLTVDQVVATPEAKKAAYSQCQVSTVNMEDYWIAEVAAEAGVPFLAVRAVLDPAHQGLPSYLMGLSERPSQIVHSTLTRPWRATVLLSLAQQARVAQDRLTRFSLAFIDHQLSARDGQPTDRR
jgi:nucleoside phosphorylase